MNHYPKEAEVAARSGNYDLCIFGHTHSYFDHKVGTVRLLNPGEIKGNRTGNPTFAIFDTETKEVLIKAL